MDMTDLMRNLIFLYTYVLQLYFIINCYYNSFNIKVIKRKLNSFAFVHVGILFDIY